MFQVLALVAVAVTGSPPGRERSEGPRTQAYAPDGLYVSVNTKDWLHGTVAPDSVAIIAIGSHADVSFVLAIQTLRLFLIILVGPPLARLIARAAPTGTAQPP